MKVGANEDQWKFLKDGSKENCTIQDNTPIPPEHEMGSESVLESSILYWYIGVGAGMVLLLLLIYLKRKYDYANGLLYPASKKTGNNNISRTRQSGNRGGRRNYGGGLNTGSIELQTFTPSPKRRNGPGMNQTIDRAAGGMMGGRQNMMPENSYQMQRNRMQEMIGR